jgi:hypothetical protein
MRNVLLLSVLLGAGCASFDQNACYETIRGGIEDQQMLVPVACSPDNAADNGG